jgi:2-polyprenyl-3-methyl-5-hydroxy-6-metoxy-1,4-benzoquinol methylase
MRSSNGYLAAFSGMDELSVVEMTQFLGECGIEISEFTSILDFGCGCGRVTRFFRGLDRATIHGSDYNRHFVSRSPAHPDLR